MATRRWRLGLLALIVLVQFGLFEWGLRLAGGSEAAPAFQQLFTPDPAIGYRLRPSTAIRYTTSEFSTAIAINAEGVRDDEIGPKPAGERRIVVLGDSLVLAVQVPLEQTFCKQLQLALNTPPSNGRYRVVNAGVQGYGPVEEALFFERVVSKLEPDLVVVVTFVANDAVEANDRAYRLGGATQPATAVHDQANDSLRRFVRRSAVMQIVRQRVSQVRERLRPGGPPRPDRRLLTYATPMPDDIRHGLEVSRDAIARLASDAAAAKAPTVVVLMPARFQLDREEFDRMEATVEPAGYTMRPDAATTRFADALAPLDLPTLDLLTAFRGSEQPARLFFQSTAHLTPEGHRVAAGAILRFLEDRHLVR
jgi:lysophospholipase L1-like esterase